MIKIFKGLFRFFLFCVALAVVFAAYLWITFPDVAELEKNNPETTPFIESRREILKERTKPREIKLRFVPYAEISPHLREAIRKSEDPLFFSHDGFDWVEVQNAIRDWWVKDKRLRGASTLSMQTARLMYLTRDRSYWRKFREALITVAMEKNLKKERIYELYLNYADWGNDVYGAENAARKFFKKSCRNLTCSEAVALAAMLPSPEKRDPANPNRAMAKHMKRLSRRMTCFKTAAAKEKADEEESRIKEEDEENMTAEEKTEPPEDDGGQIIFDDVEEEKKEEAAPAEEKKPEEKLAAEEVKP